MRVAVLGASGYIGGELVRLLLGHPHVELAQATSDRRAGQPVSRAHPNLFGVTSLKFTRHDDLVDDLDVVFAAWPHGASGLRMEQLLRGIPLVIDLSADFRLTDERLIERYYGPAQVGHGLLGSFTPGIPEIYRDELRATSRIAVPGCMANAALLALYPLSSAGLVDGAVTIDARTGSSGGGIAPGESNHHAERTGTMRIYKPFGHRHEAEIQQHLGVSASMTVTAVGTVRGAQIVARVALGQGRSSAELHNLYVKAYGDEPFVRVVSRRGGVHGLPEPRVLAGSNFCDVAAIPIEGSNSVIVISAIDNLMKGGAGNAVQSLNISAGFPESAGLSFSGLHPV